METQRGLCTTINTIHNGYYPKQITGQYEIAQIFVLVYTLLYNAVIRNTYRVVPKSLAE